MMRSLRSCQFSARGTLANILKCAWTCIAHTGLAAALLLLSCLQAGAQVTYTGSQFNVAGNALSAPKSIALDGKGILYIADSGNNRVVSIVPSSNGDAVPVTVLSGLSEPAGVAADRSGNVYVSDTGNNRVLMLPLASNGFGAPVTVSTALNGPTGIAVDLLGNLFVSDAGNNRVVEFPRAGSGFGGLVIVGTGFNSPAGLALDAARNLFIADSGNNRIIEEPFSASGYTIQDVPKANLTSPRGVVVDQSNNLYIAATGNSQVLEETWNPGPARYAAQEVIGSGFVSPASVAADTNGNLYVADAANNQVIKVTPGNLKFGALNTYSTAATLTYNFSVAAGTTLGSISVLTQGVTGKDFVDAGASTCGARTYTATVACGVNVAFTPLASGLRMGAVVFRDNQENTLATAFLSGTGMQPRVAFFPGAETQLGTQLSGPSGVAVDTAGNVYIADTGNNRVVEVPWTGSGYGAQTAIPLTGLNTPMGLAVDGAGNLYITSNGNDKVIKLAWTGTGYGMQTKVGISFYGPSAVSVDGSGAVYVADTLDNWVYKLPWTGSSYASAQHMGNYVKNPMGVAVDGSGNLYFTMSYMNELVEITWSGSAYDQQNKNVQLKGVSFPTALASDGNSNLYVLDTDNNRVVMLPWTGAGFGQQITVASGFNAPGGMTLDGNGNLYVADTGNNQVVKIDLSVPAAMNFANTYLGSTSEDSARVALVENVGNLPLVLSAVGYPPDFPEGTGTANSCAAGTSVNPGNNCELAVDFTPLTVGSPLTEELSLTDNTLSIAGTQQSIVMAGTSLARLTQTISFSPISSTSYGSGPITLSASASSGLPVTYQVVSGPAILSNGSKLLTLKGAGIVVVMATQAGNSAYAATSSTQSFSVAPAVLTITPVNVTAVYGAIPTKFNYTVSGFVLGQTAGQVLTGQPAIGTSASSISGVGSYPITASLGTLAAANYSFSFASGTLTVSKAVLTVTPTSQSIIYGSALPAVTYEIKGFVNRDTQSSAIAGSPQLTTSAASNPVVGKYAVNAGAGTLTAANYSFVFASGTLAVNRAVLTVSAAGQAITYGGALPALTYAITGFVNGDTQSNSFSGSPQITTVATAHSGVGKYAITSAAGTLSAANYSFVFVSGALTINKAVLTVTAAGQSMTYGGVVPAMTYTVNGFVSGDAQGNSFAGVPLLVTVATSKSVVGKYAIVASAGTLSSANYGFIFVNGALTVNKAVLTVIAANLSMTYGSTVPAMTDSITGFVNGDSSQSAVTGAAAVTSAVTAASPAGQYAITVAAGSLAAKNYSFAFNAGSMTVTPAPLKVTANNLSMVSGQSVPALTYSVSGWVNKDTQATASSGAPSLTTTATAASPAGTYAITAAQGTMKASNYALTFVNGVLTVTSQTGGTIIRLPTAPHAPWLPVIPNKGRIEPLVR
jgi:sugar lactone lactonase YvrE